MAKSIQEKEQIRQASAQRKKEQAFQISLKRLAPWSYVSVGLLAAAVLLFFTNWLEIYNTDIPGVEIGVSGFSAAICGVTGHYTLPDSIYGMMAAFYYWVPGPCPTLGITSFIALCSLAAALILAVIAAVGKLHAADIAAAVLSVVSAVCLVTAFIAAKRIAPDMIAGYCSGNPACSLRCYALVPAFVLLGTAVVLVITFKKYLDARKKAR